MATFTEHDVRPTEEEPYPIPADTKRKRGTEYQDAARLFIWGDGSGATMQTREILKRTGAIQSHWYRVVAEDRLEEFKEACFAYRFGLLKQENKKALADSILPRRATKEEKQVLQTERETRVTVAKSLQGQRDRLVTAMEGLPVGSKSWYQMSLNLERVTKLLDQHTGLREAERRESAKFDSVLEVNERVLVSKVEPVNGKKSGDKLTEAAEDTTAIIDIDGEILEAFG